jgi:hypothetical protein
MTLRVSGKRFIGERKNRELGQLTQEQCYKGFAVNAGKEEPGELRIAVDITGRAASAKAIETYPDCTYTDCVSLLTGQGMENRNQSFYV